MYSISDTQVDYILNDIRRRGVEMEDLQYNLLDHICCIVEQNLKADENFEDFYKHTIPKFFKHELWEIEEETILLLTYKNYYTMKKAMITAGTFSVITFVLGSFFKIMHWPGANLLLILGIGTLSFIFLPLLLLLKTKELSNNREKFVLVSGTAVGISYCIAVLGAIMHWSIAKTGILWMITCGLSIFIFIPLYFFTGIRKPESKLNTIVTSLLLVVATALHFTLVNLRPTNPEIKMHTYVQNEKLLSIMKKNATASAKEESFMILSTCEELKPLVLEKYTGTKTTSEDVLSKNILINEGTLGGIFYEGGEAYTKLKILKSEIEKYNMVHTNHPIPIHNSILDVEVDKISSYTNLFLLTELTQIQMFSLQQKEDKIALN